jgi:hypothetical protein
MPKHKERTASTRAVDPKSAKPYDHERQLVASVASLTPASSSKDVADSPAPASGSRRRKKRKRNVDTDVEPTEPDAVDEADAINGVSPAPLLPGVETPEQVLERHTAQYRADSLEKALAKERKLHEYALRALAETQSDLRTLQDAAERAEDTLKARIAALEASLNDVKAAEEKRSAEMDAHKQVCAPPYRQWRG